jgi:hypothetical protein
MNRSARLTIATLAAASSMCLVAVPGAAGQCATTHVPGDNAQVDEYAETIPGACGDHQTNDGGGSHGSTADGGGPESLAPGTTDDLRNLGTDGAAAAALAEQTAPPTTAADRSATGSGDSSDGASGSDGSGSGVGGALTGSGDGGIGLLFPILLVGALVAALIYSARRRAGTSHV